MNVVIVNEQMPYPPTAGNRIRTLNLMLRLADRRRGHRITYVCRGGSDANEVRRGVAFLRDHGVHTVVADEMPPSRKSGALFYGRLAANLLSPLPYAVASHNSPAVRRALRVLAAEQDVDLWQFEWLAYADAVSGAPRLVMAHNVESLIWRRYAEMETNPAKRWYCRQQWRKFRSFEKHILADADRVVAVSDEDAQLVRQQFGTERVSVVENGIDRAFFTSAPAASQRDSRTILFLGSLDWRPNLDAIQLLLDGLFQRVRNQEPDARLLIVGRNPPAWLSRRAHETASVELHANVPDVRPFLHSAAVLAVPLRVGGGSRLKVLEALACGLPVVSTSVGYEGLALTPGRDLLVADDPEQIASALLHCLRHPQQAQALAAAGQRVVLERYDWNVLADRLERVWENLPRRPSERKPSMAASSW